MPPLPGRRALARALAAPCLTAWDQVVRSEVRAQDALHAERSRTIDLRSGEACRVTGVDTEGRPVSPHADRLAERLPAAPVRAGHEDTPRRMFGPRSGPGWIAARLPDVPLETALAAPPAAQA